MSLCTADYKKKLLDFSSGVMGQVKSVASKAASLRPPTSAAAVGGAKVTNSAVPDQFDAAAALNKTDPYSEVKVDQSPANVTPVENGHATPEISAQPDSMLAF